MRRGEKGTLAADPVELAASAPFPDSLGGASVWFNSRPAPLLFVSPGQINAQALWDQFRQQQTYIRCDTISDCGQQNRIRLG